MYGTELQSQRNDPLSDGAILLQTHIIRAKKISCHWKDFSAHVAQVVAFTKEELKKYEYECHFFLLLLYILTKFDGVDYIEISSVFLCADVHRLHDVLSVDVPGCRWFAAMWGCP